MLSPQSVLVIIILVAIILIFIGALGYRYLSDKDWTHSFYASALTMAGLSLEVRPQTNQEKIFIAIFTLLSVGFYLILVAAIIACLLEPVIKTEIGNYRDRCLEIPIVTSVR